MTVVLVQCSVCCMVHSGWTWRKRGALSALFRVEIIKSAYNCSFAAAAGSHVPAGHGGRARVLRRRRPLGARCGVSGRGRRRRLGPHQGEDPVVSIHWLSMMFCRLAVEFLDAGGAAGWDLIKVGVVLWMNTGRSSTTLRWKQSILCARRRAPGVACAA